MSPMLARNSSLPSRRRAGAWPSRAAAPAAGLAVLTGLVAAAGAAAASCLLGPGACAWLAARPGAAGLHGGRLGESAGRFGPERRGFARSRRSGRIAAAAEGYDLDWSKATPEDLENILSKGDVSPDNVLQSMSPAMRQQVQEIKTKVANVPPPVHQLPGPLRPPAAPATYEALTTLRLRTDPSRFSEVVVGKEIKKGTTFRAVQAVDDEDFPEQKLMYLRTEEAGGGWIINKALEKMKWINTVKRVAGSVGKRSSAMLEISEVSAEDAEGLGETMDEMRQWGTKEKRDKVDAARVDNKKKDKVLEVLRDPMVQKALRSAGLDPETLQDNPELISKVASKIFTSQAQAPKPPGA